MFLVLVCEEVCDTGNVFDDGHSLMQGRPFEEIRNMAKNPDTVAEMEERVKAWMKRVTDVLKESEQIRKENNSSGLAFST